MSPLGCPQGFLWVLGGGLGRGLGWEPRPTPFSSKGAESPGLESVLPFLGLAPLGASFSSAMFLMLTLAFSAS